VHGSAQATSIGDIKKQMRLTALEAETRANVKSAGGNKRLADGSGHDEANSVVEKVAQEVQGEKQSSGYNLGDLEIIHKCMTEGKHEEAQGHLGKLIEKCKLGASGDPAQSHAADEGEKYLSALVESQKALDNAMSEHEKLIAELAK
jgi:hypothetical protein